VFERYFAGGFQSFRGFRFRGVTPRDDTGFSLGGTFQALGTVEYRLPLTADDMISAVAFSDFGSVDDEVTLSEFRATAGFGLRLTIPQMGPVPLAFDFAFPITTQPGNRQLAATGCRESVRRICGSAAATAADQAGWLVAFCSCR
ncbi:MAG: BamA/TamA family outer membrane protein, partial [Planctomycetaceae bacterium]